MDTIKESITLEKEILELGVNKMLEEPQKANLATANQSVMIEALTNKINSVPDKMQNSKTISSTAYTKRIEELIQKAIMELEVKALSQPKITTRKFQIQLFPPQDARLFYKIVFWTQATFIGDYVIYY